MTAYRERYTDVMLLLLRITTENICENAADKYMTMFVGHGEHA